jgi:hypothetical protein
MFLRKVAASENFTSYQAKNLAPAHSMGVQSGRNQSLIVYRRER